MSPSSEPNHARLVVSFLGSSRCQLPSTRPGDTPHTQSLSLPTTASGPATLASPSLFHDPLAEPHITYCKRLSWLASAKVPARRRLRYSLPIGSTTQTHETWGRQLGTHPESRHAPPAAAQSNPIPLADIHSMCGTPQASFRRLLSQNGEHELTSTISEELDTVIHYPACSALVTASSSPHRSPTPPSLLCPLAA